VAFFPQLFSISAHIIRQVLAGAILCFAIGMFVRDGRNRWLLYLLATLIHTSAAFVILLPLSTMAARWLGVRRRIGLYLTMFITALTVLTALPLVTSVVGSSAGFLSYGLGRLSSDSFYLLSPLPLSALALNILIALAAVYGAGHSGIRDAVSRRIATVAAFVCVNAMIVMLTHHTGNTEWSTRFLYYQYSLLPLILVTVFSATRYRSIIGIGLIATLPIYFVYSLAGSRWEYADTLEILTISPVFLMFQ